MFGVQYKFTDISCYQAMTNLSTKRQVLFSFHRSISKGVNHKQNCNAMQQRIGSTQFCLVTLSTWAFSKNNQTSEIDDVEIKGKIVDFFVKVLRVLGDVSINSQNWKKKLRNLHGLEIFAMIFKAVFYLDIWYIHHSLNEHLKLTKGQRPCHIKQG